MSFSSGELYIAALNMDINISPRGQKGIPLPLPNIGENYIPVPAAIVLDHFLDRTWYAHTENAHTWYTHLKGVQL